MATYKVIQDVEAEDKLLGPLTLRQFIYAGIAAIMLYLSYFSATHHASFLLAIFLPFAFICGFFAFPWGRDQPTEVWALAKIRFMLKPRRRIWDQSGAKDLVTVTAPKQVHHEYTNGLSETEVRSRLHALADTIDSRGWAIKNANLNMESQPGLIMAEPTSDRLVSPSSLPQQVSDLDISAGDDILDEKNNARAQAVDNMIEASAKAHREQIMQNLKDNPKPEPPKPAKPAKQDAAQANGQPGAPGATPGNPQYRSNDYWFLNQPARAANIPADMVTFNTQVVTPGSVGAMPGIVQPTVPQPPAAPQNGPGPMPQDEASLVRALDAKRQEMPTTAYYSHLHTIQPLSAQQTPGGTMPQQDMGTPMPGAGMVPQSQGMPALPVIPPSGPPSGMTFDQLMSPMQNNPAMNGMGGGMGIAQAVANGMPPQQPSIAGPQPGQPAEPPVTPTQQAAILQLANNNDLNVATLAREADRAASDEVVIKLH
jgi:hypothetical protein